MKQNVQGSVLADMKGFDALIGAVQDVRACSRFFLSKKKNISKPRAFEINPDSFDSESKPILTSKFLSEWL